MSWKKIFFIVIALAVIAAVAIPNYRDLALDSDIQRCETNLISLQSRIVIFYADMAMDSGYTRYPTAEELMTPGVVMDDGIPPNPFQDADQAPDSIVIATFPNEIVSTRGGWAYIPETGQIWPNTKVVNENRWVNTEDK